METQSELSLDWETAQTSHTGEAVCVSESLSAFSRAQSQTSAHTHTHTLLNAMSRSYNTIMISTIENIQTGASLYSV